MLGLEDVAQAHEVGDQDPNQIRVKLSVNKQWLVQLEILLSEVGLAYYNYGQVGHLKMITPILFRLVARGQRGGPNCLNCEQNGYRNNDCPHLYLGGTARQGMVAQ